MTESHDTFTLGDIEVHISIKHEPKASQRYTALGYKQGACVVESTGFVLPVSYMKEKEDFYSFDTDLAYIVFGIENLPSLTIEDEILAVTLVGTDPSVRGQNLGDTFISAVAARLNTSVIALECSPLQSHQRWQREGSEDYQASFKKLAQYYQAHGYTRQPNFNVYSKRVEKQAQQRAA